MVSFGVLKKEEKKQLYNHSWQMKQMAKTGKGWRGHAEPIKNHETLRATE